ncbi:MAG: beta-phosphoglucomutase family hydrolase, partial [Conexibacter sp.]|nr:beta-phosphoglucomutase family hydrolase [Conexibacter sp.]
MLGLPDPIQACLFDLDGVLTQTATVHAAAWKQMFDEYLEQRADERGEPFVAFDAHRDYDAYVDGLPRPDGVRSFLKSRGIDADEATVAQLGDRKNALVLAIIHRDGVKVYEGSVRYVHAARAAGLKLAVVSSSANAKDVLKSVGLLDQFEDVVDGHAVAEGGLKGKPAP